MSLDAAWNELILDALASDGRISDRDVKDAVARNRPHVEAAARQEERAHMRAMRHDYQTLPHAAFPAKWPDWREYAEVLPTQCDCQDCRLWRAGS